MKFLLRAKDVNHQFAVPQFRVKMDMVPGMVTHFWLTPTRTGSLRRAVRAAVRRRALRDARPRGRRRRAGVPGRGSRRNRRSRKTAARVKGDAEAGKALFATCTACHGEQAQGNKELGAPKLAGQDGWYLARQLQSFKQGVRGSHENDTYGKQMIPFASMLADDAAVRNIVAYIGSLPDTRPDASVGGNPERGRKLYATCAACHGDEGRGHLGARTRRGSRA